MLIMSHEGEIKVLSFTSYVGDEPQGERDFESDQIVFEEGDQATLDTIHAAGIFVQDFFGFFSAYSATSFLFQYVGRRVQFWCTDLHYDLERIRIAHWIE